MFLLTATAGSLEAFMINFESVFAQVINLITHLLEIMGVIVLIIGAGKAFLAYMTKKPEIHLRLQLAQSMALALEFKLGGEILRTVIARDWNEILTVGAIIVMRGALNWLIHWEIGNIKHDADVLQDEAQQDKAQQDEATPQQGPH